MIEFTNDEYDDFEPDPPRHREAWCTDCGQRCSTKWVDNGIGAYEYWGAKGVDRRIEEVSDCCEALVADKDPNDKDE
jgi:hypothetical protein